MNAIDDLFGSDPLAAERALAELGTQSPSTIERVLPFPAGRATRGPAGDLRLARLARRWGDAIVPHLVRCLREGSWSARLASAPFFGGLRGSRVAEEALVALLAGAGSDGDFDAERLAIEALGWLGADGWAWDIDHHARTGRWKRLEHERGEEIYGYAYGKLWSYGLKALALMAARAADPERVRTMLELVDQALRRQKREAPNVGPDGAWVLRGVAHHFNERQVDALIERSQAAADESVRGLYLALIGEIAPVRAARHLLAVAASPEAAPSVRQQAAIALGEVRVGEVSALLAELLRSGRGDLSAMDWAASNLYAAGGDWADNEGFYAAIVNGDDEPAAQLRYALAVRGDRRCRDDLTAELDHAQSHRRWPAALALARLLGAEARAVLRHRADDAGDDLERAGMLAALVRAGDSGRADELHRVLQRLNNLHQLRVVWRVEIVDALRLAPDGQERFEAWCGEALLNERHRRYFDEWGRVDSAAGRAAAAPRVPGVPGVPGGGAEPAVAAAVRPTKVFISYSHRDKVWLERFQRMQAPLQRAGKLDPWDDTRMQPGLWHKQIDTAMQQADAALFLVSSHFLASDFVVRKELPTLLELARANHLRVVWVLLDSCFWEETPLSEYQAVNAARPLAKLRGGDRAEVIKKAWAQVVGAAS